MPASKEARQDLRIQRTKRAMSTAMFQLLEKHSFAKITVNDVCSAAMVSRTTFYQYFQDKYELLKYSLRQVAKSLEEESGGNIRLLVRSELDFIMQHRRVFRNLLMNGANEELIRLLSDLSVASLKKDLEKSGALSAGVPADIAAMFLSGGMAALLLWWVGTDFTLPPERLAEHMLAMFGVEGP